MADYLNQPLQLQLQLHNAALKTWLTRDPPVSWTVPQHDGASDSDKGSAIGLALLESLVGADVDAGRGLLTDFRASAQGLGAELCSARAANDRHQTTSG